MRKKIFIPLVVLVCAVIAIIGLTACGKHTHVFSSAWSSNESSHWHAAECGHTDAETKYSHEFNGERCTVCGYRKPHVEHSLIRNEYEAPTCTTSGNLPYWSCSICGLMFEDSRGLKKINYADVKIDKLGHSFSDEYDKDDDFHWYAATCGCTFLEEKQEHVFENGECVSCFYRRGFKDIYIKGVRYTLDEGGESYSVTGNKLHEFFGPLSSQENRFIEVELCSEVEGKPVKAISDSAFAGCTIFNSIIIPDSIESIGKSAFNTCIHMNRIILPESVKFIGQDAFFQCVDLGMVNYGGSIADWCNIKFEGVLSNPLSIPTYGYRDYCSLYINGKIVRDVVIPDGVTEISDYAFVEYGMLSSIELPDSVERIGRLAFSGTGLYEITLKRGLTIIDDDAFPSALARVNVPDLETWFSLNFGEGLANPMTASMLFTSGDPRTEVSEKPVLYVDGKIPSGEIILPSGTTSIPAFTFKNSKVTEVQIPYGVTLIERGAFYGCGELTDIQIPDSVESIGDCSFYSCKKLKMPAAMNGVKEIGKYTFSWCFIDSGIDELAIGKNVKTLGSYAYERCGAKNLLVPSSVETIADTSFYDMVYLESITVEAGNKRYKSDGNCLIDKSTNALIKGSSNSVIPSDGSVKIISDYAFASCRLESLELPNTVTKIGAYAFDGNNFTGFVIPDSVTEIGKNAFDNCRKLVNLTIPDSVTCMPSLGNFFLYNSDKLPYDADGALYIGNHLLDAIKIVGDYTVKSGTITISDSTRFGKKLENLILPESVVYVSPEVFKYLSALNSIDLGGITKFTNSMFSGCTSLTTIYASGNLNEIESNVFSGCESLTDIYFDGTTERWNAIEKGEYWLSYGPAELSVHCTNGTVIEISA